ncbi:MAG: acetyl-CoA carboxylase carboxyl transferase subunit beta [Caldiserica bacterium]|nr:MAG: acetyl-CoA carboxylase carboxyl transferase subunit beta [Caldisericota bacterium]
MAKRRITIPPGIWEKCEKCEQLIYKKRLKENFYVCPKCGHYFRIGADIRIKLLTDEFKEIAEEIQPCDPLGFYDTKPYKERLKEARKKSGLSEAVKVGIGKIDGKQVALGVLDFNFMGGSMGSVVGERITILVEEAIKRKIPLIIVSSSGGARMQEGILSLMQMAKTSSAIKKYKDEVKSPYISILTHPTTGGVSASFAFLGDIIISEPKALIGFAGPRVIEQTIKQKLPEGFQSAEFLLQKGMIDMIVERKELKNTVSKLISILKS